MFKVNHNNSTNNTINIREISHYLVKKKIHRYLVHNKEVQVSYYNIKYTNFWSLVNIQ